MEKARQTEKVNFLPPRRAEDALFRARRERDWADRADGPDEDSAAEPTYPDGSVQHECWAQAGYTRTE